MLNENQTVVNISFCQKRDNEDECIFSIYANVYPNYRKGDTLFLETAVYPDSDYKDYEAVPLTEYRITKVVHSAKKTYGLKVITTSLNLEIFVERVK